MQKKALLAILMVMCLILSSCALIVKDEAVDAATEIIRLGDQVITKGQVDSAVNVQLANTASLYSAYGMAYDPTSETAISDARTSVVNAFKNNMVLAAKAKELGLDQLTDEEKATAQTNAETQYNSDKDYLKSSQLADSGLEGDALEAEAVKRMDALGATMDSYLTSATESLVRDKVRQYVIKDVTVTDEELQTEYDSRVSADQSKYAEDANSWASAANNGTTLYYTPAGIRRVKQILIRFKSEDSTAISDAQAKVTEANSRVTAAQQVIDDEAASEEDKAKAQADLEAAQADLTAANEAVTAARETAFANIDADTDAVLEQLANGGDWDTLMAEKNEDPGMKSGVTAEKGYAVTAGMTSFDAAFVDAAMALESVGDISGKIRGDAYGYYIIRYEGDETEGPVALDDVKETIRSTLQSNKETETYNSQLDQWVSEASFKEDLNALNQ